LSKAQNGWTIVDCQADDVSAETSLADRRDVICS
jgi:hypothetical protein